MDRWIVFLLNESHVNHLVVVDHDGSKVVEERFGGVLLPHGVSTCKVYCIPCDQWLEDGMDYIIEPFTDHGGSNEQRPGAEEHREPWEEDPEAWRN